MRPLKQKVSITLDEDIIKKIKELSEKEQRSFSRYVNLILAEHLKKVGTGRTIKMAWRAKDFPCHFFVVFYLRFSGFRHSNSGTTKRPSLRISRSSNQISPPPYSGVMMSTKSQWMAEWLPLGASS